MLNDCGFLNCIYSFCNLSLDVMWQTIMKKENIYDFIWLIIMSLLIIWGHQNLFNWLREIFSNSVLLNSAFYFSTIPFLSAFIISLIYFYLYSEFKGIGIAFKAMFFLNFVLSVVLIIGIVLLKSSIYIIYPIGAGVIAIIVKMYTRFILKAQKNGSY